MFFVRSLTRTHCWLTGLLLVLFAPLTLAAGGHTIHVAVAANFTGAAKSLASLYQQQTGDTVKLSFGSTGKLYTQIIHGAPYSVFLAADQARPEKLISKGKADQASRFTYAQGKLALFRPDNQAFAHKANGDPKLDDFHRLAIANPNVAPYGLAAKQTLQHMGEYNAMKARLVEGYNISQTFQFVRTGNASAGFVAYSQVVAAGGQGQYWPVPQDYYAPIKQDAVLLNDTAETEAAQQFLTFLKSPQAQTIIQKFGYSLP